MSESDRSRTGTADQEGFLGRADDPRWSISGRLSAATGLVFGLLLASGLVLQIGAGFPPTGESAADVVTYFSTHQSAFKAYLWTALATIPFQIWFFSTLYMAVRRHRPSSTWPVVGLVSVAVGNAATLQVNIAWGTLTSFGAKIGDAATLLALWRIYHLGGFVLGLISSTILLGFGLATLRTKGAWHGIGLLGIVAGAYSAIVWTILCFSDGRPSPLSGLSYALLIVWVFLASCRLIVGPPQPR